MMRAMKSRELLLDTPLFQVARLKFEGPDGGEQVWHQETIDAESGVVATGDRLLA